MGQVLHGRATTTEAVRRTIQNSQESLRTLAKRYGNQSEDGCEVEEPDVGCRSSHGPKEPKSTVLSVEEEATVVAFRRHTLLPLDDCLYALARQSPRLTRSSLHRCLQRPGISSLPEVDADKPAKKKFKANRPRYKTAIRSAINQASGRSWVMNRSAILCFSRTSTKT